MLCSEIGLVVKVCEFIGVVQDVVWMCWIWHIRGGGC